MLSYQDRSRLMGSNPAQDTRSISKHQRFTHLKQMPVHVGTTDLYRVGGAAAEAQAGSAPRARGQRATTPPESRDDSRPLESLGPVDVQFTHSPPSRNPLPPRVFRQRDFWREG
jgi:hypothetical protein